jgi:hypothetical protein
LLQLNTGAEPEIIAFDPHHDNRWHEYSIPAQTHLLIKELKLKPGMGPGTATVDWVEFSILKVSPLRITSVVASGLVARVDAVNVSTLAAHIAFPEIRTVAPQEKISIRFALPADSGRFEATTLRLAVSGHPDWTRTVITAPAKPDPDAFALVAGSVTMRVAPDGSGAHIYRNKSLVATAAFCVRDRQIVRFERVTAEPGVARFRDAHGDLEIRSDGDSFLIHIRSDGDVEGPVVRVLGDLSEAVFPGLEYLGAGDRSSSDRDVIGPEQDRFAPDPFLVTTPLIACVTNKISLALAWNDTSLHPTFASPDTIDGRADEHRFSLRGKNIAATIRMTSDRLPGLIEWAFSQRPWPDPEPGRSNAARAALSVFALRDGRLRHKDGWSADSRPWSAQAEHADLASSLWRVTGQIPATVPVVPGGSPLRNDSIYFITGRAGEWRAMRTGEINAMHRQHQLNGGFRVKDKSGKARAMTPGELAFDAFRYLQFARYTGDAKVRGFGLDALRATRGFTVPAGGQTWELGTETPDALAAAYLIYSNVLAFEVSGDREFLSEARRWAWAGSMFVYTWGRYPEMKYAVVPAFGASSRRGPVWFGRPVPWVSSILGRAFVALSAYDPTTDWKRVATGIAAAVDATRPSSGPYEGCLPDVYRLDDHRSEAPYINPGPLVSLECALAGQPDELDAVVLDGQTVAAPFSITIESQHVVIHAPRGTAYQYLLNGVEQNIASSSGADRVDVGPH